MAFRSNRLVSTILTLICLYLLGATVVRGDGPDPSQNGAQQGDSSSGHVLFIPMLSRPGEATAAVELRNGDFESGDANWIVQSNTNAALIAPSGQLPLPPRQGDWAGLLGGGPNVETILMQHVDVPAGGGYLTYYLRILSDDFCSPNYDVGGFMIDDVIMDMYELCALNNTRSYVRRVIDLAQFRGQQIALSFIVTTDATLTSYLLLDEISISLNANGESEGLPSEQQQAPLTGDREKASASAEEVAPAGWHRRELQTALSRAESRNR